jgi:hypothetical protein
MRYKVKSFYFKPENTYIKLRLVKWNCLQDQTFWLLSLAISKSKRQLNDWLNKRKNKRSKKLSVKLTGNSGLLPQLIAVRHLRVWTEELHPGDCIFFLCESKEKFKQFKIYSRWFKQREITGWYTDPDRLLFYYFKPAQLVETNE